jgi:Spy/CpxP family protein refolding chaperone
MKSLMTKMALVGTMALATVAFAQGPGGHRGPRGGGGFPGGMFGHALNLTDAQKEQIRSITKESFAGNQELRTQLKAARDAEQAAIKAGKSDAELAQLAQNSAPLHAQAHAARLQTEAKIFKVLTPEQQAKLAEIRANMKERMGRFARRHAQQ